MTYDPNAYDNRGFSALDKADDLADYLERERRQVAAIGDELAGHMPFRKVVSGDEE